MPFWYLVVPGLLGQNGDSYSKLLPHRWLAARFQGNRNRKLLSRRTHASAATEGAQMDLSSRWDRYAVAFLLLAVGAMTGCQGLFGGGPSSQNGAVSASSLNLDFGPVVVGNSKTLSDTLTNGTNANVTISSVAASDSEFRITSPAFPLVLAAGQSAKLSISFSPRAAGKPLGKLALMSSSVTTGEIDLTVGGSALSAGKLAANPGAVTFGNVRVGQSQAQTATLTNSGESSVTVSQAAASSAAFSLTGLTLPVTLAPGQATKLTVVFAPKSPGKITGSITVNGQASLTADAATTQSNTSSSPTSAALAVSGDGTTPGQLALNPPSISFGNVPVGTNQSQTVTLTDSGGTSTTVSAASVSGAGFSVNGLALPLTLGPGQSSSFKVVFAPPTSGAAAGSITIASDATDSTLAAAVTGAGINPGSLTASPTSLSFGSVQVSASQSQTGSITNSGGTNLTLSQASATGAGFSLSGLSLPMTLSPGQTAGFTVTFAPKSSGSFSGSVAITSGAATVSVALAGTGLASGSLGASPASVNFGTVQLGTPQTQTVTLTNGGGSPVTISQAAASGSGFSVNGLTLPLTLQAGQSTSFTATFTPGASGTANGNIAIASNASNTGLNVVLSGSGVTAGALAATPSGVSFGNVPVGSTQTKSEILTNSGGSSVTISQATLTGTGFSSSGLNVPTTLNAGQSLTFSMIFTPSASGNASGNLALTANGSVPSLNVALTGAGAAPGQLSITPTAVTFGNVTVGASQNQTGAVTAGGASVTISSAVSNNAEFVLSGLALPITLNAGQSTSFTVTFTPQASGATSGSISFASNATNTPVAASVSGTGTPAVQHTVSLSWTPSTSTVVGYNVYRGSQNGGPYVLISSGTAVSSSYTDSSVQSGQNYYYVVTGVDGSGNESVYSNQTQAVVPTP
jgi:Abnormal spindle-like microcephaly-assoc'd, ASPM-SPD-2-Hydin